ncbi:MAG: SusF/SusE family outer membrane protein [Bacteroidota bacterium]
MKFNNKLWIWAGLFGLMTTACDPVIEELNPDIVAPEISITGPAEGDTFAPGDEITITGSATDDQGLGSIRIWKEDWGVDTTFLDSAANFNISYAITIPENVNLDERQVVNIKVTDGSTNEASSSVVINFGGDDEDPIIAIAAPTDSVEVFPGDNLEIDVSVSDNFALSSLTVEISGLDYSETRSMQGLTAFSFDATGDNAFALPLQADTGHHTLEVTVTDINGNMSTSSVTIFVKPLPEFETMFMVGAFNGWDIENAPAMTKDANDGFVFTARVEFSEADQEFKFVSTQDWSTAIAFGVDENGNPTTAGGAPNLVGPPAAGLYEFTFDVKNLTFSYEEVALFETLYAVGAFQGWDIGASPQMTKVSDELFALRITFTEANQEFKIVTTQDWDTNDEFGTDGAGGVVLGGPNIPSPAEAGEYLVIINTSTLGLEFRSTTNRVFMVGDATAGGWVNTAATLAFRNGDFEYTYTGFFNAGSFKFLTTLGQWAPQYGINDGSLFFRATESDPDPGNWSIADAGYYTITINVVTGANSLVSFDEASANDYTSMGVIGAGIGGWDDADEVQMTQSTFDSHIWTLTGQAVNGDIKIRADAGWTTNWGDSTIPYGVGTQDGPNMNVPDGTYTIKFNDLTGHYVIIE